MGVSGKNWHGNENAPKNAKMLGNFNESVELFNSGTRNVAQNSPEMFRNDQKRSEMIGALCVKVTLS